MPTTEEPPVGSVIDDGTGYAPYWRRYQDGWGPIGTDPRSEAEHDSRDTWNGIILNFPGWRLVSSPDEPTEQPTTAHARPVVTAADAGVVLDRIGAVLAWPHRGQITDFRWRQELGLLEILVETHDAARRATTITSDVTIRPHAGTDPALNGDGVLIWTCVANLDSPERELTLLVGWRPARIGGDQ